MSEQSKAMNHNASAGHGDDWGMTFPMRSLGKVENYSTAHDHDRVHKPEPAEILRKMTPSGKALVDKIKWPIEYKSSNLTIYYRPNSMVHDHLVTSGDWQV